MAIDTLLGKLECVRQTGPGQWIARCPAHEDGHPSLSVRELDDGRILLHCFAGCDVGEILGTIGLTFNDLFPEKPLSHRLPPERRPIPATDILRCLELEALVVASSAVTLLDGKPFSQADRERLITAVARIQSAIAAGGVNHA